jgi:hypothetical protein
MARKKLVVQRAVREQLRKMVVGDFENARPLGRTRPTRQAVLVSN